MVLKRRLRIPATTAAVMILVIGLAGVAEASDAGDGFSSLKEKVHEFRLSNGLTFLVLERHEAPVFSFRTYVNAGSVDEITGTTGIAHMFEHMAFKGTPHIGTTDYEAEREAMQRVDEAWNALRRERWKRHAADSTRIAELEGAFKAAQEEAAGFVESNGYSRVLEQEGVAGLNAFTGMDFTQYLYSLPSNRIELWALMEGDRLTNPVLRDFYKERDVVIEERRMRVESSPSGRLYMDFLNTAFVAHPYGTGGIGWRSDLESFTRAEAEAFYEKHYVAKNMIVAVVGDVKVGEIKKLAEKYFSEVSEAPAPPPVETTEPPQTAERRVLMEDDAQPMVFIGYHMPDVNDPSYVAYDALSEVLGDGRASRLHTSLVKEQKLAVQVGASTGFPGNKYENLIFFYIVPASDVDPDTALEAFDAELERLTHEAPVTAAELDGIKTRYRARFWRRIQSNNGMAGQLATYQGLRGDWRVLFDQVERVDAITVDDLMRAAKRCLRPENRTVGILRHSTETSS